MLIKAIKYGFNPKQMARNFLPVPQWGNNFIVFVLCCYKDWHKAV